MKLTEQVDVFLVDQARRLPLAVTVSVAIVVMLAWSGPLFRKALAGAGLPDGWGAMLAKGYVCAVVATFAVMLLAAVLASGQVIHYRGIARRLRVALDRDAYVVGKLPEIAKGVSTVVREVCESDAGSRQSVTTKSLLSLLTLAVGLFQKSGGANRAILFEEQDGCLVPRSYTGFTDQEIADIKLPLDRPTVAGYAYTQGESYNCVSAWHDPSFYRIQGHDPPGSVLCVPIWDRSTQAVQAVLSIDSQEYAGFTDDDAGHLQVIVAAISAPL